MPRPSSQPARSNRFQRPGLAAVVTVLMAYAGLSAPASAAPAANSPAEAAQAAARQPVITEPPMGWNDWNTFGCSVSAQLVEQTADVIVAKGLKDAGYSYVDIDDCWLTKSRDADGKLVPDPVKFPDGIKAVADYVHAKGLKLGIYEDAGTATCAGYPGSLGHEATDAQTFADWDVDLLKYDNCNSGTTPAVDRYQVMSDALAATGRKIVLSICEWGVNKPWEWGPSVGDYWRIDGDITDTWNSVRSIGRQLMRVGNGWSGPGYQDPDMLEVGNGGLNPTEERTHFGLWSLYGAPLILGNDLRSVSADSLAVISNRSVIAVDQQAAGHAVRQVSAKDGRYVLTRAMDDGSRIVALYNETATPAPISTTAAAAGLSGKAYDVTDLWSGRTSVSAGALSDQVPAHGLTLLRVSRARSADGAAPVLTFQAPRTPGAQEYLTGPDGVDTTVTVSVPNGGGSLRDLTASLDLPTGWTTRGPATVELPRIRSGETKRLTWHVRPTGSAPGTLTAHLSWRSPSGTAQTRDLALVLTPKPAVASGLTSVAALPWLHAWAGYGTPQRNRSIEGQTLSVAGTTYATGIGTHASSEISVWLGGRCTSLTTSVGVQDGNVRGSIRGVVLGDGRQLAATPQMTNGQPAAPLNVDVTGVDYLELHTEPGDNSSDSDRTVWAGTQLTCAGLSASGDTVVVPGQAGKATTSFVAGAHGARNVAVSLDAPSGWTVTPTGTASASRLDPWATLSTDWSVTAPAGTASGPASLTARVTYTDASGSQVTSSQPLSVSVARSGHYAYSQQADASYKRLTRTVAVPAGGGALTFWTDYDVEQGWDHLFVEARTPGGDDWTTLPDANGHTTTAPGDSCVNGWVALHPQLAHYQTWDGATSCTSTGTTGSWNAATGSSGGWQQWKIDLSKWAGSSVEVSIAYASDWGTQGAGVLLDDAVLPDGTTSTFEDGLDGWSVPGAPAGTATNPNDFEVVPASQAPLPE